MTTQGIVLTLCIAFLVYTFGLAGCIGATETECWRLGYPNGEVGWDYSRYCKGLVNLTEIIVPLEEARKNKK